MIDVEQRALRPFEQNRPPLAHGLGQQHRHVADPRLHPIGERQHLLEHRLPVHGAFLDQPVARRHVVADVGFQTGRIGEIADANAAAGDLVLVRGSNAARRGADLPLAAPCFRQQIEIAVVWQDQMRLVAEHNPVIDIDACADELVDFGKERLRVDDDPVADDAGDAGMQDAGGNEAQDETRPAHVHRVAGVMPTLITRHQ